MGSCDREWFGVRMLRVVSYPVRRRLVLAMSLLLLSLSRVHG